jgi:hypothetical protein
MTVSKNRSVKTCNLAFRLPVGTFFICYRRTIMTGRRTETHSSSRGGGARHDGDGADGPLWSSQRIVSGISGTYQPWPPTSSSSTTPALPVKWPYRSAISSQRQQRRKRDKIHCILHLILFVCVFEASLRNWETILGLFSKSSIPSAITLPFTDQMGLGKVVVADTTTLTDFKHTYKMEDALLQVNDTWSGTKTNEMPVVSSTVRSAVDGSKTPKVLTVEGYGIWWIPFVAKTISCAIKFEWSDSSSI